MQDETKTKEQLIDELTRQNKYLTALYETSWYIIRDSFLRWADSFNDLVQRAGYLLNTPHAFLGLVDLEVAEEEREIEYTTGTGIFSQRTKVFDFLAQEARTHSQKMTTAAFARSFQESSSEIGDETTIQTVIVILLRYKVEFLGILGVAYDVESGRTTFDEEEIELLLGFADLVAAGVSNFHDYGIILKQLEECKSENKE